MKPLPLAAVLVSFLKSYFSGYINPMKTKIEHSMIVRLCERAKLGRCAARDERGLTLIEIIIVLVILSLIMSFLASRLFSMGDQAKAELTRTKMASVKEPLYMFQMRENTLPSDLTAAGATDPTDGWGRPLQYKLLDGSRSYELKSLGADGREGGTGADADIIVKGP